MATTLVQYWTNELARLNARQLASNAELAAQRAGLLAALAAQRAASDAVRGQAAQLDAARQALAAIAMPADGDPLLAAMEQARVGLADAQSALATADLAVLAGRAERDRLQAAQTALAQALADAERELAQQTQAAAARQAMADALTVGALATLAADAAAALASHEADARERVEAGMPTSATGAESLLKRVRARRALATGALTAAAVVEAAAFGADRPALAQAQRAFDAAVAAVRGAADAAPQSIADSATLARLAALPAPSPPDDYPILTRWQHDRLHDPALKPAREAALAKLTAVDAAGAALRDARQAHDLALQAAMKAEPDKTTAELDAGALVAEHDALAGRQADLAAAQAAMSADERATVKSWFAAVPDPLWSALDQLDAAIARLASLVGPPTPAERVGAMVAAEAALATALAGARLAQRSRDAATDALRRATGALAAQRDTLPARALAGARGGAAAG